MSSNTYRFTVKLQVSRRVLADAQKHQMAVQAQDDLWTFGCCPGNTCGSVVKLKASFGSLIVISCCFMSRRAVQ